MRSVQFEAVRRDVHLVRRIQIFGNVETSHGDAKIVDIERRNVEE